MERRRLLAEDGEHLFALGELGEGDLNHLEAQEFFLLNLGMFTSSDSLRGISTEVAPDMMTAKNLVDTKLKILYCQSQRGKLL